MPLCPHCRVENPPAARFCNGCGARLGEGPRETRKVVTVLFSDIVSSTPLGEQHDPESVRRVMLRYFEEAKAVLERHGGTVEKFIGDAVMAVFGVPLTHEDDALRAVRAAWELRTRLDDVNEELERDRGVRIELRTGIHTGQVVAGDSGSGQTFATGDAVNTAKRLEEAAGAGGILLGEPTWRLVKGAVSAEAVEGLALKGKSRGMTAYRLLELEAQAPPRRHSSPLIGREEERRLLSESLDWVVESRACHMFTLQGAAGVGKSRVTDEFAEGLDGRAAVIRGRCLPYGEGITFWPVMEIVREATGLSADDPGDAARAKIQALLDGEEHAGLIAECISQLIGVSNSLVGGEEGFWAVRRFLEILARQRPLVVLLDDLHWAEPSFLDLVEHVAEWSRDAPIMLLCLARPELLELRPNWGTGKVSTTVLLEPLGERESSALIENAIGAIDEETRTKIIAGAEGNPLFLEEMVASLLEEGELREVPPTIQALLAARVDRLAPNERPVIEAAAIEGRVFHRGAVTELVGDRLPGQVGAQLARLVHKDLIWPARSSLADEEAFRFRHLLIRDAAYDSLPKESRADLHERFAGWLDERGGQDEVMGYHLERAYRYRTELGPPDERARRLAARAGELLGRAGRRAFARDDMHAALVLLDRAVALVNDQDPARLELVRELSNALWTIGEVARAESLLNGLIEAAAAAGDRRIEWYALLEQAGRRRFTDPTMSVDELYRVAEDAIPVFEELGDELGLARAWRRMSQVATSGCHFGQGEEAARHALEHARAASDAQEEARSIDLLCTCLLYGPAPADEGVRRCVEMLDGVSGNLLMQANIASSLSGLLAMRGKFEDARTAYSRAEEIYEDLGLRLPLAGLRQIAGEVELLADEPEAAERELRRAHEAVNPGGAAASLFAAQLGRVLMAQQRADEAAELSARSLESCGDDVWARIVCLGLASGVEVLKGSAEAGVTLAQEAVTLAEDTDALNVRGDALVDLAQALRNCDRESEAVDALERAGQLYERKGNLVARGRAAALLGQHV